MNSTQLSLNNTGRGAFFVNEADERVAEMIFSVSRDHLTVYHTEVFEKGEGKGLAKQLLDTMVEYARSNNLKVIPLCPYVLAQFKRHPELYNDVWSKP